MDKPTIRKFDTEWSKHEALTVGKMKDILQQRDGFDKKRISLCLKGIELDDNWTAADFGLYDGAVLEMTFISKSDFRKKAKNEKQERREAKKKFFRALEMLKGGQSKQDVVEDEEVGAADESEMKKGEKSSSVVGEGGGVRDVLTDSDENATGDENVLELSLEVDGTSQTFTYSEGEDPHHTAFLFCQQHNLGEQELNFLVSQIRIHSAPVSTSTAREGGPSSDLNTPAVLYNTTADDSLREELEQTRAELADSQEALLASRRFNNLTSPSAIPSSNTVLGYALTSPGGAAAAPGSSSSTSSGIELGDWNEEKRILLHAANADREFLLEENRMLRETIIHLQAHQQNQPDECVSEKKIMDALTSTLKPVRDIQKQDLDEIRRLHRLTHT
jgi:hypothetical protein